VSECLIRDDVTPLFIEGETPVAVYKTFRETAVFTNLRPIVRDAQGLRGKSSTPTDVHTQLSVCGPLDAGTFLDINAELEL
jgi:hypothetical protein